MDLPEKLQENEYLLKIRPKTKGSKEHDTGFLSKFNKDGSIPKAFDDWGVQHRYYLDLNHPKEEPLPITVHVETFKKGWKIVAWRFGMSQNWATMLHPDGFTVEIKLQNLLELLKKNTLKKGELVGEFKWEDHKLIKK